jgi:hypothetical protein
MRGNVRSSVDPVLALILVSFLALGCARVGEPRTERRSVELEDAESVRTDLTMNNGNMMVAGDAEAQKSWLPFRS